MGKVAVITGITGQDGSYLSELLLEKGYTVHGIVRRSSTFNTYRIDHLIYDARIIDKTLFLHYGDLTDGTSVSKIIRECSPDACYNLGAQSHVKVSFEVPEYSANVDGLGTIRLLDAIKTYAPACRYYQASTSEMFGNASTKYQNEDTPFKPCSPYAAAKLYAYWTTISYRMAYGIFACNGILFNHTGERRGATFVSRKISRAVARIHLGKQDTLILGNLDAQRDWGYAKEFCDAMYRIMNYTLPDDYVIATGTTHSVREFVNLAFAVCSIDVTWEGSGASEVGINRKTGSVLVAVNEQYYRPTDVKCLRGDYSKAKATLGWEPRVGFNELVDKMVQNDLKLENTK